MKIVSIQNKLFFCNVPHPNKKQQNKNKKQNKNRNNIFLLKKLFFFVRTKIEFF